MIQNKFQFIGRLTRDAYYVAANGEKKAFATFDLAVDGYDAEHTDFFTLKAFGSNADYIGKYTSKGTKVIINGRVTLTKEIEQVYTKQDGTTQNFLAKQPEFIVEEIDISAYPSNKTEAETPTESK
jgi:single-stranded DNA-binding protein